jgi:hypothetical protein
MFVISNILLIDFIFGIFMLVIAILAINHLLKNSV